MRTRAWKVISEDSGVVEVTDVAFGYTVMYENKVSLIYTYIYIISSVEQFQFYPACIIVKYAVEDNSLK